MSGIKPGDFVRLTRSTGYPATGEIGEVITVWQEMQNLTVRFFGPDGEWFIVGNTSVEPLNAWPRNTTNDSEEN